jgi:hypothetical protein
VCREIRILCRPPGGLKFAAEQTGHQDIWRKPWVERLEKSDIESCWLPTMPSQSCDSSSPTRRASLTSSDAEPCRLSNTIFRRDAENHTRDGYAPRKDPARTRSFVRLRWSGRGSSPETHEAPPATVRASGFRLARTIRPEGGACHFR